MRQRITSIVSALLSGIPIPALASTPLGEILFCNKTWSRTLSSLLEASRHSGQLPTSLHDYLSDFGIQPEVVEQWILKSLEHDSGEDIDPSIPLLNIPNTSHSLSFKPVRHEGIVILLVTAIPHNSPLSVSLPRDLNRNQHPEGHQKIVNSLEQEIGRLRASIEMISATGSQFVREVGHEYRTPLNSILGLLELTLLQPLPEKMQLHLSQAETAARDLLTMVNDVVEFADLDIGSSPLQSRITYPAKLIERILTLTHHNASAKKLEVVGKVADIVPERIVSDEQRLGQILLNTLIFILENATLRGGIVIYADHETGFTPGERSHILRISFGYWDDEVTDEEVRRLFATYSNGESDYSAPSALSRLRLSLVGRILDRLGGGVNIRHIPHRGVRIEINIPVGDASEKAEESAVYHPNPDLVRRKILIAEDNAVNAKVMALMLEHLDAQFVLVKNGSEAIEAFKVDEAGFELILMDCEMPEVDGFEATRAIRLIEEKNSRRTPIVAMTAYALPGAREACFDAGMDEFLLKPISARQLSETLETFGLLSLQN